MESKLQKTIDLIAARGRSAALALQDVKTEKINKTLLEMARQLTKESELLRKANARDLTAGKKKGLSPAMLDRLTLSSKAINAMITGLKEVASLPASVGTRYELRERPNGLNIYKVRTPIGVVGIIYESRPNVTVDAAAICLKSHNAVILRGGSEAFHSNMALVSLFQKAAEMNKLPTGSVQFIPSTDRSAIDHLLTKDEQIDLIIPRGGESLIRTVVEKSRIPVIKHYKGICHVFISAKADMSKALPIIVNAKVQRPGVCNAMETLLISSKLPIGRRKQIINALIEKGVTLFGDPATRELSPVIKAATENDWRAEYLDLRCAVRTVNGLEEAIDHINTYGSHHTDAIVTEHQKEADRFVQMVDSASVMVNTSTRFADGSEYGMGCEIGISTDKLHSRGPMGIDDLTTYKWIVEGTGQIRE
ncbi:MAG: glutamate-5-semialdehyde dehydrogenase [Chitinispirillaceae bacterium]|nr:glutamate-5-semialdehyde dehydrogenase [Chitinispirillaceae bacterium]